MPGLMPQLFLWSVLMTGAHLPASPGTSPSVPTVPSTRASPEELARRGYRIAPAIPYRIVDGEEIPLDVYVPLTPPSATLAVVVYIHGGSWRSHSRKDFDPNWLPVAADMAFVAINYRLAPRYRFPAQLEDCRAALLWVSEHAHQYQLDPARLAVMGSSAGGHLALLLATGADPQAIPQTQPAGALPTIRAAVAFYPPTDFLAVGETVDRRPGRTQDPPGHGPIELLLGSTPAQNRDLARLASPIYHVTPNCPPVMLLHGSADLMVPVEQSTTMAAALRAAGVACELIIVPGADHGFPKAAFIPQVRSFLRRHLAPVSQSEPKRMR
jgi:acetyl esterase/lipase